MDGSKNKCTSRQTATWFMVACCSFALLIWAKLRLVTGVPRTAYAEPEKAPPKGDEAKPKALPQAQTGSKQAP
jgi:hypothetical protein